MPVRCCIWVFNQFHETSLLKDMFSRRLANEALQNSASEYEFDIRKPHLLRYYLSYTSIAYLVKCSDIEYFYTRVCKYMLVRELPEKELMSLRLLTERIIMISLLPRDNH